MEQQCDISIAADRAYERLSIAADRAYERLRITPTCHPDFWLRSAKYWDCSAQYWRIRGNHQQIGYCSSQAKGARERHASNMQIRRNQ